MKLQPASKKEVRRMAVGCLICTVAEIIGFALLSFLGYVQFRYPIIVGSIGGALIAIGNFTLMCLMVQSAAGTEDQKLLKAKVQASYNFRLFIQAGWIVAAFLSSHIHVIAAAIPLLFPTAVIYYLQATGKLMPKDAPVASKREAGEESVNEDPEQNLNSFEV